MLGRVAFILLLTAAFAAPAHADPTLLMPGVVYDRTVTFTPHGAVVVHVVTAPRPGDQNGLYALTPALAGGTITGGTERLTQLERDVAPVASTVGIDGDLFSAADGHPSGIVLQGGKLVHAPLGSRSSIGIDSAGVLHVDRVRFFGTWQGAGQRRTLATINAAPGAGETVLYTPAYGVKAPAVTGSVGVVLEPFGAAMPNTDLAAVVTAQVPGGGQPIPADGAVLLASGAAAAAKLQAEAPVGSTVHVRLILQPAWAGVTDAIGGGPALVRGGKPVFRSLEDFTNDQVSARTARAAVGQLADGRIVLVAVDGGRPGWSSGLTSYELAQTLARLGAVTASAVAPGDSAALAADGALLSRPSGPAERAVKDALLVRYLGVAAPPPPVAVLTGEPGRTQEQLSYRIVRPSTVTAQLVAPDQSVRAVETAVAHLPGTYSFPSPAFDREGTWRWHVAATDDLGRTSTADQSFRYDATLTGLAVPRAARGALRVRFTLSRPAQVALTVESPSGVAVRAVAPASLPPGSGSVTWDGRLPLGTRAFAGTYVASVVVTSAVGRSEWSSSFVYRR